MLLFSKSTSALLCEQMKSYFRKKFSTEDYYYGNTKIICAWFCLVYIWLTWFCLVYIYGLRFLCIFEIGVEPSDF